MTSERALCAACGTDRPLKQDGTFRKHQHRPGMRINCRGSALPPGTITVRRVGMADFGEFFGACMKCGTFQYTNSSREFFEEHSTCTKEDGNE